MALAVALAQAATDTVSREGEDWRGDHPRRPSTDQQPLISLGLSRHESGLRSRRDGRYPDLEHGDSDRDGGNDREGGDIE